MGYGGRVAMLVGAFGTPAGELELGRRRTSYDAVGFGRRALQRVEWRVLSRVVWQNKVRSCR
jgi:hypothetical protein